MLDAYWQYNVGGRSCEDIHICLGCSKFCDIEDTYTLSAVSEL